MAGSDQVEEFLSYLELERGLSPTTRSSYRQDLKAFQAFLAFRAFLKTKTQMRLQCPLVNIIPILIIIRHGL